MWPINPNEVTDRQIAPSTALRVEHSQTPEPNSNDESGIPLFSPELEACYQKRYEEGYDLKDSGYVAWLKINHPELDISDSFSDSSSEKHSHVSNDTRPSKASSSSDVLSELLLLPEPKRTGTRRGSVNGRAICISKPHVLKGMKLKEERKKADEQMKLEKKAEWERKKLEREEMRKEKEQRRKKKTVRETRATERESKER